MYMSRSETKREHETALTRLSREKRGSISASQVTQRATVHRAVRNTINVYKYARQSVPRIQQPLRDALVLLQRIIPGRVVRDALRDLYKGMRQVQ